MAYITLSQEVKECAISCMGLVLSTFGDNLKAELPACLPVLVDRMGNEITRLTAVKVWLLHFFFVHSIWKVFVVSLCVHTCILRCMCAVVIYMNLNLHTNTL